MKASLIVALLGLSALAQLADPFARFSYSGDLARRSNAADAGADAPRFIVDDVKGRELAAAQILGAIQSLIRAFPGCGNRELQFAYAYGETPASRVIAFSQATKRAPECPATVTVALSPSGAVTVRSAPES